MHNMLKTDIALADMPDHARLWVLGSAQELDESTRTHLLDRMDEFIATWNAHGHPVTGGRDLLHNRFLLIAADEEATGVSGCSIDSLYRVLKGVEREFGLTLLDSSLVYYRDVDGEIRSASRAEFRRLVEEGAVTPETQVFDNTVTTVGALRRGEWARPMKDSWHAAAFKPRG